MTTTKHKCLLALGLSLLISFGMVSAQTWQKTQAGPTGADLNTVFFLDSKDSKDSKRGWMGGDAGFIGRTEDGGQTWTRQKLDTSEAVNDIYFTTKDNGFLLAGAVLWATSDGGATWQTRYTLQPKDLAGDSAELYSVRFSNKKHGWVVGSVSVKKKERGEVIEKVLSSFVLRTEDGGQNWQRWGVLGENELLHLDLMGDKRAWLVGAKGTIIYTANAGESWQIQRSNTTETLYHVDFRNDKNGLAVGRKGTILRTFDGGITWVPIMSAFNGTLLSVAIINDDEVWAIGRGGVLLKSMDGGLTWTQQEIATKNNLYGLYFDKKAGFIVGGDGLLLSFQRVK